MRARALVVALAILLLLAGCSEAVREARTQEVIGPEVVPGINYYRVDLDGMPCIVAVAPADGGWPTLGITCDWSRAPEAGK